jgi:hypothetical protein
MAEAVLALEGAHCVSLGVQTPLWDIALAAKAYRADIVALSFTACLQPNQVVDGLAELRSKLPPAVALWVGGSAPVLHRRRVPGVAAGGQSGGAAGHAAAGSRSASATGPTLTLGRLGGLCRFCRFFSLRRLVAPCGRPPLHRTRAASPTSRHSSSSRCRAAASRSSPSTALVAMPTRGRLTQPAQSASVNCSPAR